MIVIYRSEGSASLRRVPMWLVGSTGTAPATAEGGGQPQINWLARGTATVNTTNTLSLVSANAGEYYVELVASEVSALGVGSVQYRSANAIPNSTYFQIVNWDSGNSTNLGVVALPAAAAATAGGLLTFGTSTGQINPSLGSVDAQYLDLSSKLTVGVGTIAAGTYSAVTVQSIASLLPGNFSSTITFGVGAIKGAVYSAVSVRLDSVDYSSAVTVGVGKFAPGNYSGVTFEMGNSGITVGQAIADRIILRSPSGGTDSGRSIGDALRALRNRVEIGSSIGTVYQEDDVTSAWTFSFGTTASQIFLTGINPAGGAG